MRMYVCRYKWVITCESLSLGHSLHGQGPSCGNSDCDWRTRYTWRRTGMWHRRHAVGVWDSDGNTLRILPSKTHASAFLYRKNLSNRFRAGKSPRSILEIERVMSKWFERLIFKISLWCSNDSGGDIVRLREDQKRGHQSKCIHFFIFFIFAHCFYKYIYLMRWLISECLSLELEI